MNKIKGFPIFLVTLGLILLLETTNIYNGAFVKLWPLLLIIIGTIKIINTYLANKSNKKEKKQ